MAERTQISLIAFYGHYEILHNILDLLRSSSFLINIFTSDSSFTERSGNSGLNIIYTADDAQKKIITGNYELLKHSVLTIAITVFRDFEFYNDLAQKIKLALIVHNTHFSFHDCRFSGIHSVFQWILPNKAKLEFITNLKSFLFLSHHSLHYAIENYPELSDKFSLLPYCYNLSKSQEPVNQFTITIPGGINHKNRDYHHFMSWLNQIKPNTTLEVVFLGKSRPPAIKKFEKSISNTKITIRSFYQYVDQQTYLTQLRKTDLLLAPLKPQVKFRRFRESYGYSKISGAINDCIKFAIPLVLPTFYPIESSLKHLILRYSDQKSFDQVMDQCLNSPLSRSVLSEKYTLSKVRENLIAKIMAIIQS